MIVLRRKTVIFLAVAACVLIVAIILAVPSCSAKLGFKTTFFYVCYDSPSDSYSASSVSSAVQSYGGAGYVVEDGGKYFVTVACYYKENDAVSVCKTLQTKGLKCNVKEITAGDYDLKGGARSKKEQYLGNLNTLLSLSKVCYNLANSIDKLTCDQEGAKALLADVKTGLESLARQNSSNCFSSEIAALIAECKDAEYGYVRSPDVRRLQIAMCDCIVNIKLF